jgi:hypothetical protein
MPNALQLPPSAFSDFIAERFGGLSSALVNQSPSLALGLAASPVPTHRMPWITDGLVKLLAAQPTIAGLIAQNAEEARLRIVGEDPDLNTLPPEYQAPAAYVKKGALALFDATEANDPLNLVNLVVDRQKAGQFPGAKEQFILRSSVQDMLNKLGALERGQTRIQVGTKGLPPAAIRGPLPTPRPEELRAEPIYESLNAEDVRYNGQRARALVALIQQFHPDAEIKFQDGTILAQVLAAEAQISNLLNVPTEFALRQIGSGLSQIGIGKRKTAFASPAEVFSEVVNARDYAFGEQYAKGLGLRPTDPEWNTVVGVTNFIGAWKLDLLVVAGKGAGALRLAGRAPLAPELPAATRGEAALRALRMTDEQALYRQIGRPASELVQDFDMSRVLRLNRQYPGRSAELIRRHYKVSPGDDLASLSSDLATAQTKDEGLMFILDRLDGTIAGGGRYGELIAEKGAINERLVDLANVGRETSDEYANLVLRQRHLTARIDSARNPFRGVIHELPRPSFVKAIREEVATEVAQGTLSRAAGSALEWIVDAQVGRIKLSRIYQDLPNRLLRNPHSPEARPGALNDAANQMDAMLRDFNVSAEVRREIGTSLLASKGPADFFDVVTKEASRAIDDAVAKNRLPGMAGRPAVQFFNEKGDRIFGVVEKRSTIEGGRELVEHRPTWYKIVDLPDGGVDFHALPSKLPELVDDIILPGHDWALQVTGAFRRFMFKRGWGKFWSNPDTRIRGLQGVEDMVTGAWKDAILLARAPAVLTRIQLEQMARIAAAGKASAMNRPLEWLGWLRKHPDYDGLIRADELDSMLGLIVNQMEATSKRFTFKKVFKYHNRLPEEQEQFINSVRVNLLYHSKDPGMKVLSKSGVDGFLDWATTTEKGKWYTEQMRNIIEQGPGSTFDDNLRLFAQSNLDDQANLLRSNEQLKRAITDGYGHDIAQAESLQTAQDSLLEARALRQEADSLVANNPNAAQSLYERANLLSVDAKQQLRAGSVPDRTLREFGAGGEQAEARLAKEVKKQTHIEIESEDFNGFLQRLIDEGEYDPSPAGVSGYMDEPMGSAAKVLKPFRNAMYRNLLSREDAWLSRRPLFRQFADEEFRRLSALGVKKPEALRQSVYYGARQTADLLYDLSARTSSQNFFRHLAPFLPAWQEVATTWMWKIPSRHYPMLGHAYLGTRVKLLVNLLNDFGIDPSKPVDIPGVGEFLENWLPGPDVKLSFQPKDLNIVGQTILPGLGPIPSTALSNLAKKYDGVIDDVAEVLLPFGLETQLGPASLNRAWFAVTGKRPPWEFVSPDYQDLQYGFALTDSIRATYVARLKAGDKPPDPKNFPAGEDFRKANDEWIADLLGDARKRVRAFYGIRSIFSVVAPAPIAVSDEVKQETVRFYERLRKIAGRSEGASAAYDSFIDEHPFADLYLTPASLKDRTLAPDPNDSIMQQLLKGQREKLSPEDFTNFGLGLASRRLIEKQVDAEIKAIGGPAQILWDWRARGDALSARWDAWDRYRRYNKDFDALWTKMIDAAPNDPQFPKQTLQAERIRDFVNMARDFGRDRFISDAVPGIEFGKLASMMSAAFTTVHGQAIDAVGKGIDKWFRTVYDPVARQLDALRPEADNAKTKEAQGRVFDKMRKVLDQAETLSGYPTVEEFWWGAKDQENQEATALKLNLRKPEWLSRFQFGQAGYGDSSEESSTFLNFVNQAQKALADHMKKNRISSSSNEGDRLEAQIDEALRRRAEDLGVGDLYRLVKMAPYQRLRLTGRFSQVPLMRETFLAADAIATRVRAAGFKPGGGSALADSYEESLYVALDAAREKNPELDQAWNEIEVALGKERPFLAHPAYRALLWGRFFGS